MPTHQLAAVALAAIVSFCAALAGAEPAHRAPNILLIVADDMGYSDIGALGGEIDTPNLDALAAAGVLFTSFHTGPTCSPTRAMLLSGVDAHRAGLGNMAELLADRQLGKPGYEGYLNDRVASIAEILRDHGYATAISGKWHLGREPGRLASDRGFERSFTLLQGGASHFDQRGLSPNDPVALYRDNGAPARLPAGRFSSDYYTDRLLEFLAAERGGKPFFGYLAFTAPHWPLQAPDALIEKYAARYAEGWGRVQARRGERQRQRGLPGTALPVAPANAAWDALDEQQRRVAARKMAIYAAMVDNMDHNIGRVLDWLRTNRRYDDTLIVFMSDNGATDGSQLETLPAMRAWLELEFDNRFENLGRRGSYVEYGARWAAVSNTPFSDFKGTTREGGIRVPAIFKLPAPAGAGARIDDWVSVLDVVPTLLGFAGVELPAADAAGAMRYRGRQVYHPVGRDLGEALRNPGAPLPPAVQALEFSGKRMVYEGGYKAVYDRFDGRASSWRLFDIAADAGETRDLAAALPERLAALVRHYHAFAERNGVVELADDYSAQDSFLQRERGNR